MRPAQLVMLYSRSECNNISNSYLHRNSHDLGYGCGHASDYGNKGNFK